MSKIILFENKHTCRNRYIIKFSTSLLCSSGVSVLVYTELDCLGSFK
jgi:hypothetical protein